MAIQKTQPEQKAGKTKLLKLIVSIIIILIIIKSLARRLWTGAISFVFGFSSSYHLPCYYVVVEIHKQ